MRGKLRQFLKPDGSRSQFLHSLLMPAHATVHQPQVHPLTKQLFLQPAVGRIGPEPLIQNRQTCPLADQRLVGQPSFHFNGYLQCRLEPGGLLTCERFPCDSD
ncbi:MAG: hypothetical protein U0871_01695 [Gemmataceae bacterium]